MKTIRALIPLLSVLLWLADTTAQQADTARKQPPAETRDTKVDPAPVPSPNDAEKGLRMNFRGVPLEMVLDYLSDAAGFIIILETEVKGKVDAWSNAPLGKQD